MATDFNFYDVYAQVTCLCYTKVLLMSFDSLIFLIGSNWILHIISELIFVESNKKYEYPEFPILECGDPEKYQVSTKQPLNL